MSSRARLGLIGLTAALLCLGTAPAATAEPVAAYVALGDSFAAAPLVPMLTDLKCHRSSRDYPAVLAATVGAGTFRDVSCDSAGISDLTEPQETSLLGVDTGTVPAQFDALSSGTTLVTMTIGGGDSGLVGIAMDCVNLLPPSIGKPCRDDYVKDGVDSTAARIDALAPRIGGALEEIHARAPQARVIVTGYGTYIRPGGCWPVQPFYAVDADYIQQSVHRLNQVIAGQAAAHDAEYVDVATPGVGHDACAPRDVRWLEGLIPGNIAAPLHPNRLGSANFAALIAARLA